MIVKLVNITWLTVGSICDYSLVFIQKYKSIHITFTRGVPCGESSEKLVSGGSIF